MTTHIRTLPMVAPAALIVASSACGGDDTGTADAGDGESGTSGETSGGDSLTVTVGYQSKTINTVTAGTLLRELGYFEDKLAELGEETDTNYDVVWEDYPSGPPITQQMLAGNMEIGSMGDYPALVNGATTQDTDDPSRLVSITGYNLRGSLNGVVVPVDSEARTLADLEGEAVSTSVGSAAHGMLVSALDGIGLDADDVDLVNQEPSVGASALESGQVAALAQFVPWPEVMIYRGIGRKLFDGGDNELPTMHGVLFASSFMDDHPDVAAAFLAAQMEATEYLHDHPLEAAMTVADITGLEAEVVYLFNGPAGVVSFDMTIKPELTAALEDDLPFLESLGALEDMEVEEFVDDTTLAAVYGEGYDDQVASLDNPIQITGTDEVCETEVDDPATASEAWFEGSDTTVPAATPACLLQLVAGNDSELRVGYVPDTATGTRMFAATASWVDDPEADEMHRFLPFATLAAAEAYVDSHDGASITDFEAAVAGS